MDSRQIRQIACLSFLALVLSLGACRVRVSPVGYVQNSARTELKLAQPGLAIVPLPASAPVRLSMPQDSLATDGLTLLAYYRHGYTPLGACTYKEVLDEITQQARAVGATQVRLIQIYAPDDRGSCYRMEALFYK